MIKIVLLFSLSIISALTMHAQDTAYIDIGNARALVNANGILFSNLQTHKAAYEIPKGSGKFSIFSSSFIIIDKKEENHKRTFSGAYSFYNQDSIFKVGPVDIINQQDDADPFFERVWSIYQSEIDAHIQNWNDPNYTTPTSILEWPGNGNSNTALKLAPFADLDKDGIYEPLDGEYPVIKGDQAVFFILNDYRAPLSIIDSSTAISDTVVQQSANIEVQVMIYAYDNTHIESIKNSVFASMKIINRANSAAGDLQDLKVSIYADFDIGYFVDDYIATDTVRSMVYGYNGDDNDESAFGNLGYGKQLPAQGLKFLNSGLFSASTWNQVIINKDPNRFSALAKLQRGFWEDGTEYFYGGSGHFSHACADTNKPTKFIFDGDPAQIADTSQWTEANPCLTSNSVRNIPRDVRIAATPDLPAQLLHDDTLLIDFAYVFAVDKDTINVANDAVSELFLAAEQVQYFYDSLTIVGLKENQVARKEIFDFYPNPSSSLLNLKIDARIFHVFVYDFNGRLVKELRNKKQFSVEDLKNGIYLVKVHAEGKVQSKKLVVEK